MLKYVEKNVESIIVINAIKKNMYINLNVLILVQ